MVLCIELYFFQCITFIFPYISNLYTFYRQFLLIYYDYMNFLLLLQLSKLYYSFFFCVISSFILFFSKIVFFCFTEIHPGVQWQEKNWQFLDSSRLKAVGAIVDQVIRSGCYIYISVRNKLKRFKNLIDLFWFRFSVDKRIFVVGFGVFGSIHGPSEYEVTCQINHTASGKLCGSNLTRFSCDGSTFTFRVMFKEPIEILPNTNYTASTTLKVFPKNKLNYLFWNLFKYIAFIALIIYIRSKVLKKCNSLEENWKKI